MLAQFATEHELLSTELNVIVDRRDGVTKQPERLLPQEKVLIRWRMKRLPRSTADMGHGYCGYEVGPGGRPGPLVAFVDRFAWSRGAPEAVVFHDAPRVPIDDAAWAAFRAAVEAIIRQGGIDLTAIAPRSRGIANG